MIFKHKRKPTAQEAEAESQSTYSASPDTSSSSSSSEARSTLSRRLSLSHTLSSLRPRPPDPDATPVIKPPGRGFGAHVHKITTTAGIPFNKAAHLVGAEGWFPQTMPRECAKAARILRSFTGQPLGATEPAPSHVRGEPYHPLGVTRRSIVTIPYQVFAHCAGLAIFNTLRAGAYMGSLAAGSGLVVARRPDDTWSPPSSFVVSTLGAGFMFGLDIYECVLVLNTPAQVAAFTHPRLSLGAETSVAIGPVGTGGAVEAAVSRTSRSMYSYMKSRGLWAGIQVDGTIILARQDCNSVAYNERGISARRILQTHTEWPEGSMPLWQTLIALEGQYAMDWDMARELAMTGTPGDFTPPMEEDEEEEPAPAYTSRPAPQFRSTHGVMNANQNGVEPSPEQKEMMLRRGA